MIILPTVKKISALVLFIIISTATFSQENVISNGVTIKPFLAFSISAFLDTDAPDQASLNTYAVGVYGDYYLSNTWSFSSGIIKDKMGGSLFGVRFTSSQGSFTAISEVKEQEFITIPVLANWHFGSRKRWNLAFGGGYSISVGDKLIANDQVNSNFVSGLFNIGYSLPAGPGTLNFSLDSLFRIEESNSPFSTQRRGMFIVGYAYPLN
jgi:hypothetical protein